VSFLCFRTPTEYLPDTAYSHHYLLRLLLTDCVSYFPGF
jgi:hypothetical protein